MQTYCRITKRRFQGNYARVVFGISAVGLLAMALCVISDKSFEF